jgi:hypothetical protein
MQTKLLEKSIFLLVTFVLVVFLLWFSTRKPSSKTNDLNVLKNDRMIELQHGSYLFSLNSEYRLAVSVEEEGKFSLRLYDKTNNYIHHISHSESESFISLSKNENNITNLVVDDDCDGIPNFRVTRNEKSSDMPVKEKLRFLAEP